MFAKLAGAVVVGLGAYIAAKIAVDKMVERDVTSAKADIDQNYLDNLTEDGKLPAMWASMARLNIGMETMKAPIGGSRIYEQLIDHVDSLVAKNKSQTA